MKPLDRDSRRLIDEASAADQPTADAEARIWQTLAQRMTEPLPPTAAAASQALGTHTATGLFVGMSTKAVIAMLVCGTLGAGAVWYAARSGPSAPPVLAPPQALQPSAAPVAAPTPPASSSLLVAAPTPPSSSSLLEETRLIAQAQRALSAGTPLKALRLIAQHEQRFPEGTLAPERDAARVLALCALGRTVEAQRVRQAFMRRWPDSPLSARVRAACQPVRRAR